MPVFRLGELFCGPGGLAWGAMNAKIDLPNYRIEHAWANDYDSDTCNTYRHNICPHFSYQQDGKVPVLPKALLFLLYRQDLHQLLALPDHARRAEEHALAVPRLSGLPGTLHHRASRYERV